MFLTIVAVIASKCSRMYRCGAVPVAYGALMAHSNYWEVLGTVKAVTKPHLKLVLVEILHRGRNSDAVKTWPLPAMFWVAQ